MKILLINNNSFIEQDNKLCIFNGTGEFAKELMNLGNKVELFHTRQKINSSIHTFNVLGKGFKITSLKMSRYKILTYFRAYIKAIFRVLHNDFLYIYYPNHYAYLAFFAIIFRKKYGLNVRGCEKVNSRMSKLLYRHAFVVFTVSPGFTDIVNAAGGRGYTQKPAIQFSSLDCVYDRVYNNKDKYDLLFLARIDRKKGIFDLIDALKILKTNNSYKFSLKVVGDGPDFDELKQYVTDNKIEDCVTLCGAVTEPNKIRDLYRNSDLYVLPTYYDEGFPRTIYEAMIFGTPVLTTFIAGIPYLMKDGVNCIKIDTKSPNDICEKLMWIMANYSKTKPLVGNGLSIVSKLFDPKKESHAQMLNQLLVESEKL